MLRPIVIATAIAGTLDLLAAFVFSGMAGASPMRVLQFVASGPFGDVALANPGYAAVGLIVHFAIMTCMVATYMLVAPRMPVLLSQPVIAGLAYGLILWLVMYWLVRPMRWSGLYPDMGNIGAIASQLFCHLILVGLPIAFVAKRYLGTMDGRA